jgi:hypothetical protein
MYSVVHVTGDCLVQGSRWKEVIVVPVKVTKRSDRPRLGQRLRKLFRRNKRKQQ